MHSLYKTSHLANNGEAMKKEFFEKIYINREVVQEASVIWFIFFDDFYRRVKETNRSIQYLGLGFISFSFLLLIS